MTQYRYTPLSGARQIRLLELHAGAKTDQLSVDLIHISLDKTPFFVALSYPWGSPQPRKAIRCSDLCAEIGPSLHSALQHLRRPDRALFVWADALCINQEDIPERTQQVRMMGDIYAAAGMTAIWLGEESDEAKLAHGWLRRFDRIASEFESDSLESDESSFIDTYQDEKILDAAFGKNRKAAFKSIWALLDRPWFTRKWVIQELVKSRRPLLIIGSLPPLPLAGIGKLVSHVLDANTDGVLGMPLRRATILTGISTMGDQILLFLVARTLAFRCGDPRDHIFTLVGIASDAARFNMDLIDYDTQAERVWQKLADGCVSDSLSLKLLWSLILFMPLKRRVRSWVPNLENLVEHGDGSRLASLFTVQQVRDFNASGALSVLQAHVDIGNKTLSIRGRILDRVQLLASDSQRFGHTDIVKNLIDKDVRRVEENISKMNRDIYLWLEECMAMANGREAFRDALLDDSLMVQSVPEGMEAAKNDFFTLMCFYKALAYEADWRRSFKQHLNHQSSQLLGNLITERAQRRFGRTENGRLGWMPPVAEQGDLICVFDGMELPYAIRPGAEGRYYLIGECIITGIMMGEACLESPDESETIILE